MKEGCGIRTSN